jgi:hypothetical protein
MLDIQPYKFDKVGVAGLPAVILNWGDSTENP